MTNASDLALAYFHKGYNCAQSVFAALAPQVGLSEEAALKFSAAFGAGLGRMRGTCGAFSGLCMVAGHCKGNLTGNPEDKEIIFSLTRALADDFKAEGGFTERLYRVRAQERAEKSATTGMAFAKGEFKK